MKYCRVFQFSRYASFLRQNCKLPTGLPTTPLSDNSEDEVQARIVQRQRHFKDEAGTKNQQRKKNVEKTLLNCLFCFWCFFRLCASHHYYSVGSKTWELESAGGWCFGTHGPANAFGRNLSFFILTWNVKQRITSFVLFVTRSRWPPVRKINSPGATDCWEHHGAVDNRNLRTADGMTCKQMCSVPRTQGEMCQDLPNGRTLHTLGLTAILGLVPLLLVFCDYSCYRRHWR